MVSDPHQEGLNILLGLAKNIQVSLKVTFISPPKYPPINSYAISGPLNGLFCQSLNIESMGMRTTARKG